MRTVGGAGFQAARGKSSRLPKAVLRSLHDLDGDFELQAPAAGGSNGVLVPPWLYEGTIAVTSEAQSPYRESLRSRQGRRERPPGRRKIPHRAGNLPAFARETTASCCT